MAKRRDKKAEFLKSRGALNQKPNSVQDEIFKDSDFFDSRDLVQVRYEMLRSHFTEGRSVSEVSRSFGLSRQFFYQLANIFKATGLLGLLPRKRGPKGPHKCFEEILDLAEKIREKKPDADFGEVCQEIEKTQGVHIHPRTLEKTLLKREKKPSVTPTAVQRSLMDVKEVTRHYEDLRIIALEPSVSNRSGHGYSLFLRRGMPGWLEVCSAFESTASPAPRQNSEENMGGKDSTVTRLPQLSRDLINIMCQMVLTCAEGVSQ